MEAKRSIAISMDIDKKLNSLVGCRFTKKALNKKLSELFKGAGKVIKIGPLDAELEEALDADDLFGCEVKGEYEMDLDIFYIRDKRGNYYITETNFEYF